MLQLLLHRITVLRTYMLPIVTDWIAWSLARSVYRSITLCALQKKAKATETPFVLETRVGPWNHVLDIDELFEPNAVLW